MGLALALVSASCGGTTEGDEGEAEDVARAFFTAIDEGEWGTVCQLQTEDARKKVVGSAGGLVAREADRVAGIGRGVRGNDFLTCADFWQFTASYSSQYAKRFPLGGHVDDAEYSTEVDGDTATVLASFNSGTAGVEVKLERPENTWLIAESKGVFARR
jgi:hypothetical protein